ncbi:MAG: hypothetical protein ACREAF_02700 [Nitrosopumilaceae archaeon]
MIIVFVIFSFFSIPIVYGLPIFWGKHVDGKIWSIDISEDGRYMAAGVDLGENKGKVYFIDKNGNLLWSQEEDRIIGKVSLSKDGSFVVAGTRLPDYTSKSDNLYFFVGGQKPASEHFFNDTKPLSPIEAIQRYPSEHAGSGSPLLAWDANQSFFLIIILAIIFGSLATAIFLKSKVQKWKKQS